MSKELKGKIRLSNLGKQHVYKSENSRAKAQKNLTTDKPWNKGTAKRNQYDCPICGIHFEAYLPRKFCSIKCYSSQNRKENNYRWIADRNKIKLGDRVLHDPLQKQWRRSVKDRDNWKCRVKDENCNGRLEAHHIKPWKDYPKLRFEVANGVTLCHFHHPFKESDVKALEEEFLKIVNSIS